jgi:tRNA pseudouridine55 synthase
LLCSLLISYYTMSVVLVNKPEGLTPLQALRLLQSRDPKYAGLRMTYAGRLDPMASGLLIFLYGDEIASKDTYLGLPKNYSAQILLGIESDSDDVLGIVTQGDNRFVEGSEIEKVLQSFEGKTELSLPIYSSPPLDGEPMFSKARKGEISRDNALKKEMVFNKLTLHKSEEVNLVDALTDIETRLLKVEGDFRQAKAVESWRQIEPVNYQLLTIGVECGSGSYVRSLAYALGKALGTKALLYGLRRERIGNFELSQAINLQESN